MSFNLSQHVRSSEHKDLSGSLSPSGRFSVCQVFRHRRKQADVSKVFTKKNLEMLMLRCEITSHGWTNPAFWFYLRGVLLHSREAEITLGSSNAANSNTRRSRGSNGITPRQRDILCWSANALERVYGKSTLSFLTYTLPPLHDEDLEAVQANWPDIVKYTIQQIKRELENAGINSAVVGCTELQMERAEKTGRFYPHLHLVFRGKRGTGYHWAISPRRFRSFWLRSVRRYLNHPCGSWKASENVQPVKRSVGGYLAKYISKGSSKTAGIDRSQWHPKDWVVLGRRLRGLYTGLSQKGYEVGLMLLDVVSRWEGIEGYKRPIVLRKAYSYEAEWEGEIKHYSGVEERKIGEYGWLRGHLIFPTYADIHPYGQRCP